jgi:steroid delta-isomerase-like uncharacterized protein
VPNNTQQILELIVEFWNTGNPEFANQLYSDNVRYEAPSQTDNSPEEIADYVTEVHRAFPDFKLHIHDSVSYGDRLISQWTCSGTHRGEYQGIPPTGKSVRVNGITMSRIKDGQITHEHAYYDRLSILEQIGAVPSHIQPKTVAAAEAS